MSFGHGGPSGGPGGQPPHGNDQRQQAGYGPAPQGPPEEPQPNPYLTQPARQPPAAMPPVQLVQDPPPPWAAGPPPAGGPANQQFPGGGPHARPSPGGDPHAQPSSGGDPHARSFPGGGPGRPHAEPFHAGPGPDWSALADAAASRKRRKRLLHVGGGILATLAVAAVVATAVVSSGSPSPSDGKNSALPSPETLPTEATAPTPSFSPVAPPPPPDPKEFISSAQKDKAPLSADTLFPGNTLTLDGRSYTKGATNRVSNCAAAAQGALGSVLTRNGCDQVIRATFSTGGAAVTVGVAVFDTEAQALKAKSQVKDGMASLPGAAVPTFCRNGTICRKTANSYGRYAYFTVSGFTDNKKNVTTGDRPVYVLGDDTAKYTFLRIVERGRAQASAAATTGTARS